jgi:hypothetical protein
MAQFVKFPEQAATHLMVQNIRQMGWDRAHVAATQWLLGLCQEEGLPVDMIKPSLEKIIIKMHQKGVFLFSFAQMQKLNNIVYSGGMFVAGQDSSAIVQTYVRQQAPVAVPPVNGTQQAVEVPVQPVAPATSQPAASNVIPLTPNLDQSAVSLDTPPTATNQF